MTRAKREDGFTLVELLASMVILAILASVMIPSMAGFLEDANKKVRRTEARMLYTAAQTVVTELNGAGILIEDAVIRGGGDPEISEGDLSGRIEAVLDGAIPGIYGYQIYLDDTRRRVTAVEYEKGGYRITWNVDEESMEMTED